MLKFKIQDEGSQKLDVTIINNLFLPLPKQQLKLIKYIFAFYEGEDHRLCIRNKIYQEYGYGTSRIKND